MNKKSDLTTIILLLVIGCGLFYTSNSLSVNSVHAVSQDNNTNYSINEGTAPDHLNFSTFLGGAGSEYLTSSEDLGDSGITIDTDGNIIVVGRTESEDFPTNNAHQDTLGGGDYDAFIAKLSPDGQTLIFATYLGGSSQEWATSVATCANGDIVVVGTTMSNNFPTLNAYQTNNNGGSFYNTDIFLAKFSSTGTLLFSTYFGGTGDDWGYGVDVDSSGRIVITGSTMSTDLPTKDAYQSTKTGGGVDCYVTVFSSNGGSLVFSTYLGSSTSDAGSDIKFDSTGDIVVVGITDSTSFPVLNGYDETYNGGAWDGFVSKFEIDGDLVFSTFIGGAEYDDFTQLAFDLDDNIIAVGSTTSYRYSVTEDAFQTDFGGVAAGLILILASTGDSLLYSSFYSGSARESISGVAVDSEGNIVLSGFTASDDLLTEQAYQSTYGGGSYDGFVCKLNSTRDLVYATYLGGSSTDIGQKISVTSSGNIVVLGCAASSNFPVLDAYQDTNAGEYDMYITKFNLNLTIIESPTNESPLFIAPLVIPFVLFFGLICKQRKRK